MTVSAKFDHDAETVFKVLTDPGFLVERNLAIGEISAEYDKEEEGEEITLLAVRKVRRALPGVLAKVFDPVNIMDMTETWYADGDGWSGDWSLGVRGQPVTVTGHFELVPSGSGCQYSVSHKAKAKIPLLGGKIEKYILGQTSDGAIDELEYLRKHLA